MLRLQIDLVALDSLGKVRFLGRPLHAFALDLIARGDPTLAKELHGEKQLKPFTVAGPLLSPEGPPCSHVVSGRRYTVIINGLEDRTASALRQGLESGLPEVALGDAVFKAVEIRWEEAGYDNLFDRYFPQGSVERRVELLFQTPTAFKSGNKVVPLPLPELVFGSLLDRWNLYSPFTLTQDLKEFAREQVAVSYYDLKAWNLDVAGGRHASFVGRCGFYILKHDPYWSRGINLLADYAKFASVGIKTSMGMGCTRRVGIGNIPQRAGEQALEGRRQADP